VRRVFLIAASMLPSPLLNYWDGIVGFIIQKGGPALSASSGVLSSLSGSGKKKEKKEEEERIV
jgi:hypothetical protein